MVKSRAKMSDAEKKAANQRSIASRRKNEYWTSEAYKQSQRRWRQKNPERMILQSTRTRAKKFGIPFDISLEDVPVPELCPVLGIPLFRGKGKLTNNSPSIDRKVPAKGYVKGNVLVISYRANRLKYDCTSSAELRAVADYVDQCAGLT